MNKYVNVQKIEFNDDISFIIKTVQEATIDSEVIFALKNVKFDIEDMKKNME